MKNIATEDPGGRLIEKLIKHDIAVYAAHTNLDVAKGGVNDLLAEALQLENTSVLVPTFEHKLKKLAVFVPEEHIDEMLSALGDAGAGAIGEYSQCSFTSERNRQIFAGESTNPYIGQAGKLEKVSEVKMETIYPEHLEKKVISSHA